VLAAWLRRIGYRPHMCGFVANVGCSDRAAERVERRLEEVHARYDCRVALIGHSRGGHYARALGHRRPELVSHAISIGAGLRRMLAVSYPTQTAVRGIRAGVLRTGRAGSSLCLTDACDCAFARDFAAPFPVDRVRLTSIYSKQDGVVRWQSALVDGADCVEVTGSHTGLIFNRKTYRVIAQTLAVS
jgi:pimeloyl-ACP methyl ester carboxylesterase